MQAEVGRSEGTHLGWVTAVACGCRSIMCVRYVPLLWLFVRQPGGVSMINRTCPPPHSDHSSSRSIQEKKNRQSTRGMQKKHLPFYVQVPAPTFQLDIVLVNHQSLRTMIKLFLNGVACI